MRWFARLTPVVLLAACGGNPMLYRSVGEGRVADVVECASDAIGDEGFTITDRNDEAGLLLASYTGTDDAAEGAWLEVQVKPDEGFEYAVEIQTSDDARAREAAAEIAAECGWAA